ncbi:uncharacterized protein LOC115557604 isoform X1 [Gadus morhua]|uniref:uncharacterized protein LOC115557604 isoform X1 n=2 Tax=Gadus morhua TaxID=8049 RepID=UPI0011B62114|nr:uncharacterized protein LOC115557604 isoform X1 [Gadus morhua]
MTETPKPAAGPFSVVGVSDSGSSVGVHSRHCGYVNGFKMFHYMLVYLMHYTSRRIPSNERLKFQTVNAICLAFVLVPQFYVMGRPKSSRYCQQPLLNNLSASLAMSIIASGFSVLLTVLEPVPVSFRAAYHVFGLLSFGQGLCTTILTLTATSCVSQASRCYQNTLPFSLDADTTPELYYLSLTLTVACVASTTFFAVKGGMWIMKSLPVAQ